MQIISYTKLNYNISKAITNSRKQEKNINKQIIFSINSFHDCNVIFLRQIMQQLFIYTAKLFGIYYLKKHVDKICLTLCLHTTTFYNHGPCMSILWMTRLQHFVKIFKKFWIVCFKTFSKSLRNICLGTTCIHMSVSAFQTILLPPIGKGFDVKQNQKTIDFIWCDNQIHCPD